MFAAVVCFVLSLFVVLICTFVVDCLWLLTVLCLIYFDFVVWLFVLCLSCVDLR